MGLVGWDEVGRYGVKYGGKGGRVGVGGLEWSLVWYGMVWYGMGMVWYGMVWYGMICALIGKSGVGPGWVGLSRVGPGWVGSSRVGSGRSAWDRL